MVNRKDSRDDSDAPETNNRSAYRKGSKTSDHSDTRRDSKRPQNSRRDNDRNGDRDNLRKRDGPSSRNYRKRSESSDSSGDRRVRRRNRDDDRRDNKKKGRFDSSDESRSDSESDADRRRGDRRRSAPSDRDDQSYKRQKQSSDNPQYEVYVGDLSFDAIEADIRDHFKNCGEILQIKLLTREDGKSRGRGFIKFADEKSVKDALDLNNTEMMGRRIVVELPANKSNARPNNRDNNNPENNSVIVRNLPYNFQESDLGDLFEGCGSIKNFRIIKNESGQSKGFGFVDFESTSDARNALNKDGTEINGRNITVSYSLPKTDRSFSNNNRGFGGNNRDRGGYGNSRGRGGYRRND